jgi:DNA-binding IclR family transcriptional regulator
MKEEKKYPAPAVARGIEVLNTLNQYGSLSLERLSKILHFPKSSCLRILDTLLMLNTISRNSVSGEYTANISLVPVFDPTSDFFKSINDSLSALSKAIVQTTEWYIPAEKGMTLLHRCTPDAVDIRVIAKIGFERAFQGELEAVATLGNAFFNRENYKSYSGFWTYFEHGKYASLPKNKAVQKIVSAQKDKFAIDPFFNTQGARRLAHIVFKNDKPAGIIAIIQNFTYDKNDDKLLKALQNEAERLSQF